VINVTFVVLVRPSSKFWVSSPREGEEGKRGEGKGMYSLPGEEIIGEIVSIQ
jgi:hypothetical protein